MFLCKYTENVFCHTGPLLSQFITNMQTAMTTNDTTKMYMYSAVSICQQRALSREVTCNFRLYLVITYF